jgi:hypothetical protein
MQDDAALLIAELKRVGEPAFADQLDRAQHGSTSGEILDGIGAALLRYIHVRAKLRPACQRSWDELRAQADRAYPGWTFWRRK